jgi:preprotein translocase subunit YajC
MQNASGQLIFIVLIFAILYFLMIRPQQRRLRALQSLQSSLQLGDEIITSAGFFGTIRRFDGEVVTIELSPGVEARVNRRAISGRVEPAGAADDAADDAVDEGDGEEERPGA